VKWRIVAGGVALIATVVAVVPDSTTATSSLTGRSAGSSADILDEMDEILDTMKVSSEQKGGFSRALFSENLDTDRDGCRTSEEVLIRDSTVAPTLAARCRLRAGSWTSVYDGRTWTRPSAVRVDRLVSLREAWESGAHAWTSTRRAAFANNLLDTTAMVPTTGRVAVSKGDKDPSNWLPPLASYHCAYVRNWVALKAAWSLSMDQSEYARVRTVLTSCSAPATTPGSVPTTVVSTTSTLAGATVQNLLASIVVQGEFTTGYARTLFPHWKDMDGNGCDTREEVLIRDSITPAQVDPFGCQVRAGDWRSPYDGATWTDRGDVDIDHVVALKEAWDSGAHAWSLERRTQYANDLSDPRTLLAVTDSVNQSKSDKDPAQWMPPLASYHCTYLQYWVSVKARWDLSMDTAEYAAVSSGLSRCTSSGGSTSLPVSTPATSPASSPVTSSPSGLVEGFVSPGAFCTPQGARGVSSKGVIYTCKTSATDSRARWRQ
jgi:hypothetical protein